jgi:hypothetical protein
MAPLTNSVNAATSPFTLPERSDGSYDELVPADPSKTTKRRLAAVVSADAVGYSRLMSENEEATIAALGAAREIFRSRVAGYSRLATSRPASRSIKGSRPNHGGD